MENKKKEILEFYKQIFSNEKLKERIGEKARQIKNEEDLRKLIREEIVPLMKKFKVNFSEEELLNYEKEALKVLSENDLKNVSGGSISVKSLMAPGLMAFMLMGFSAAAPQSEAMFNEVDNRPQVSWFTRFTQYISSFFSSDDKDKNTNFESDNFEESDLDLVESDNLGETELDVDEGESHLNKKLFKKLAIGSNYYGEVNECVSDGENLYEFKKTDESKEVSIALIAKNDQTEWKIPEKVFDIDGKEFIVGAIHKSYYMENVKKVTVDTDLKKIVIDDSCFYKNKDLEIVDLSEVQEALIGKYAFCDCSNLTSVILPSDAEKLDIGESAFSECISLEEFNCSGKIINIDKCAFSNCENLQKIALEGEIIDLGKYSFSDRKNLNEFSLFCKTLNLEDSVLYNSGNNKIIDLKIGADEITRKNPSFFDYLWWSENFGQSSPGDDNNFNDAEGAAQSSYNGNDTDNANLQRLLFSRPQNINNDSSTGNSTENTKWEESSVPKTADINAVAGRKKVKPVPKYENPFSVLSDDEDYE